MDEAGSRERPARTGTHRVLVVGGGLSGGPGIRRLSLPSGPVALWSLPSRAGAARIQSDCCRMLCPRDRRGKRPTKPAPGSRMRGAESAANAKADRPMVGNCLPRTGRFRFRFLFWAGISTRLGQVRRTPSGRVITAEVSPTPFPTCGQDLRPCPPGGREAGMRD